MSIFSDLTNIICPSFYKLPNDKLILHLKRLKYLNSDVLLPQYDFCNNFKPPRNGHSVNKMKSILQANTSLVTFEEIKFAILIHANTTRIL